MGIYHIVFYFIVVWECAQCPDGSRSVKGSRWARLAEQDSRGQRSTV